MEIFCEFLKNLKLAVKQCYQTGQKLSNMSVYWSFTKIQKSASNRGYKGCNL